MVKIKRISPGEDVTLEITAPKEMWRDVADYLYDHRGSVVLPASQDTKDFIRFLYGEICQG